MHHVLATLVPKVATRTSQMVPEVELSELLQLEPAAPSGVAHYLPCFVRVWDEVADSYLVLGSAADPSLGYSILPITWNYTYVNHRYMI